MADVHILALKRAEALGGAAFNLGSGRGYSVGEVVEAARKVTGRPIPWPTHRCRPGDPAVLQANRSLALSALDWHPTHQDLDVILSSAWSWHQAHPNGYAR